MADFTNSNTTEKVAPATLTPEFKDFYNLRFASSKPYTIQGQFSKEEMEKIIKDVYDNVKSFGTDYDKIDSYLELTSVTFRLTITFKNC